MRLLARTLMIAAGFPARLARFFIVAIAGACFYVWESVTSFFIQIGLALSMIVLLPRASVSGLSANASWCPSSA